MGPTIPDNHEKYRALRKAFVLYHGHKFLGCLLHRAEAVFDPDPVNSWARA